MIKIPLGPFKDFGAYTAHVTKPKAEGETSTSVVIEKTLVALNKIGIPVTHNRETEKINKRIHYNFSDIKKLINEDPEPKPQF